MTLEQKWGPPLKAQEGGRKEMGEECYIILNIYCFLPTGLGVTLKPRGIGLVSVQVSEILGQKATEKKSLSRRKKSMTCLAIKSKS